NTGLREFARVAPAPRVRSAWPGPVECWSSRLSRRAPKCSVEAGFHAAGGRLLPGVFVAKEAWFVCIGATAGRRRSFSRVGARCLPALWRAGRRANNAPIQTRGFHHEA